MKNEFIDFVKALMEANPDLTEKLITPDIQNYFEALANSTEIEKPELTENGATILKYMQTSDEVSMKARDIAEGLFISSRAVSGALRKLVNDGFAEKIGQTPVTYTLTEKGKNYNLN